MTYLYLNKTILKKVKQFILKIKEFERSGLNITEINEYQNISQLHNCPNIIALVIE